MYALNFVLVLIAPVAMMIVGFRWWFNPPAFKEGKVAYRTQETEKSEEVWYFAHQNCGKLWVRFGLIMGVIATALMLLLKASIGTYILWLLVAEMFVLCVTIVIVDLLVKNLFDENGVRVR